MLSVTAGIPNIAGYMQGIHNGATFNLVENQYTVSGVFYKYGSAVTGKAIQISDGKYSGYHLGFSASRSNALYGKSTGVTPLSCKCQFFIAF